MPIPPCLNPKSIQINWRWFFGKNLELSYKIQSLRPLHIEGDLMAQNGVRNSSKATPVKTNIAKYQCFDVFANGFIMGSHGLDIQKSRTSPNWTTSLPSRYAKMMWTCTETCRFENTNVLPPWAGLFSFMQVHYTHYFLVLNLKFRIYANFLHVRWLALYERKR